MRKLLIILGLLLLGTVSADTVKKYYRAFGDTVDQVRPEVRLTLKGSCSGQSQHILREDAWRCSAQGTIYDPCFLAGANKTEVICPAAPWIAESVKIELGDPLNNEHHTPLDMSRTYPWAIELANGELCQAIDSKSLYDGMPVRYRCREHHYLVGSLQRCQSNWSMLEKKETETITVELKKAWF